MEDELSFTKTKLKLERGWVMELQVMEESTIRLKHNYSKVMAEKEQLKAQTKQLEGRYKSIQYTVTIQYIFMVS